MRLHKAQQRFHAGGSADELRELLATDIRWTVPGRNAIAGNYSGIDEVLRFFERRRELAAQTFRMQVREILTGEGNHIAALTDGTALIRERPERWSTVPPGAAAGLLAPCPWTPSSPTGSGRWTFRLACLLAGLF